jgi:hypothetical protein
MRMNKPARRSLTVCSSNCAVLSLLFAAGVPALFAAPLQSPWDGKHVAVTEAAYSCPAIAHIAPDLVTDGFYRLDDPTHSIIDPVRLFIAWSTSRWPASRIQRLSSKLQACNKSCQRHSAETRLAGPLLICSAFPIQRWSEW